MNWNRYDKEVTQVGTQDDNKYQIGSYIIYNERENENS